MRCNSRALQTWLVHMREPAQLWRDLGCRGFLVVQATMLGVVFLFLIAVNVAFVPFSHWLQTFRGFFTFSGLPHPIDWGLIGALAATAGSGGIGNLTVTNWVRDKGFGMGSKVGAIPSAIGGHQIPLSHVGKVFEARGENLARWREWMRYVNADQIWVWGLFCFFGMYLNVNLATAIIPAGTDLQGLAAGAYQAQYLKAIWPGFWFLTLFNGSSATPTSSCGRSPTRCGCPARPPGA